MRRPGGIARRFEFPELAKPGVYVVDFIGGGKSSRALIRKGRMHALVAHRPGGPDDPRGRREEPPRE